MIEMNLKNWLEWGLIMADKSLEVLQNVKDTTIEIINLIGEENDAIVNKNFKAFKSILSRKYNLMRSYDALSLELSEIVGELKKTNPEELNELVDLTQKLNDACDVNTKLLSHEQEIALNIIDIMKEVASESAKTDNSSFMSVKA